MPVIATRAGGMPEVVRDGETGRLVPPRDPAALAAALVEALRATRALRAAWVAGRGESVQAFSIDRTVSARSRCTIRAGARRRARRRRRAQNLVRIAGHRSIGSERPIPLDPPRLTPPRSRVSLRKCLTYKELP